MSAILTALSVAAGIAIMELLERRYDSVWGIVAGFAVFCVVFVALVTIF